MTPEEQIAALEKRLEDAVAEAESNPAKAAELKALVDDEIVPALDELKADKAARDQAADIKAVKDAVADVQEAVKSLKTPGDIFSGTLGSATKSKDEVYTDGNPNSFYADVKAAAHGNQKAIDRIATALGAESTEDIKAMTEGDDSAGGFLVPDLISTDLIRLREQATVVRSLCSQLSVTAPKIIIPKVDSGLTAEWVEELAEKPEGEFQFSQISAEVHTAAGLAVVSNQLLADARPSIDGLISQDLGVRLANLEEIALINGAGGTQPLGILNTPGIGEVTISGAFDVQATLDAIYEAIITTETDYVGEVSDILMHPILWGAIEKARPDSAIQYLIGTGGNSEGRRGSDPRPGKSLFGVPVRTTRNVPTNLGAGTNETAVIVGNFREGLILDREGVTVDSSEHVKFTSNQTIFRAEMRVGFTAERYVKAFTVVGGTGLAGVTLSS